MVRAGFEPQLFSSIRPACSRFLQNSLAIQQLFFGLINSKTVPFRNKRPDVHAVTLGFYPETRIRTVCQDYV